MKKYICIKDFHSTTDIINTKIFKPQEAIIKSGDILMKIHNNCDLIMSTHEPYLGISEFNLRKNSDYFSFSYAF